MVVVKDQLIGYRVSIAKGDKNHVVDMDDESDQEQEENS